jgi:hypothetical protein
MSKSLQKRYLLAALNALFYRSSLSYFYKLQKLFRVMKNHKRHFVVSKLTSSYRDTGTMRLNFHLLCSLRSMEMPFYRRAYISGDLIACILLLVLHDPKTYHKAKILASQSFPNLPELKKYYLPKLQSLH